ncbi:MFS transporter [Paraburkholderia sacchari]|nr:hypothetical protein [Paraburkholderia sacchari]
MQINVPNPAAATAQASASESVIAGLRTVAFSLLVDRALSA